MEKLILPATPTDQKRIDFEKIMEEPDAEWDKMTRTQDEKIKEEYRDVLWNKVLEARENPFPNSLAEENPDMPALESEFDARIHHKPYIAKLSEYGFSPTEEERHFFGGDPNTGYKLRLNVSIADIETVSNYLKEKKITHKFLHGADSTGEVFTIYVGSKDRADAVAAILSEDLGTYLKKPVGTKEHEFAPNVIGYFVTPPNPRGVIKESGVYFSRYPSFKRKIRGVPTISTFDNRPGLTDRNAYDIAYNYLADSFGTYFYGKGKQENQTFDESQKIGSINDDIKPESDFDTFIKSKLKK